MTPLWTRDEAVAATGGSCAIDWQASGVSIDTRTLQKGDIYVALSAARDGHDFVADALNKGAAAALVSRIPAGLEGAPLLQVPDVLKGLEALGIAARARCNAKIVAITGSVGKTGSKEMLRCALMGQAKLHVAEKSYNNHEGVPLTLARMPQDTEIAICEIGMNHPGEIAPLTKMVRPHIAMITTVAPVHLAAFGTVRDIALEKSAIFAGIEPEGIGILNADLPDFDVLCDAATAAGAKVVTFGTQGKIVLNNVDLVAGVTVARASNNGTDFIFKLNTSGAHLAMNALGVLAVVDALGADIARATLGLMDWQVPDGRGASYRVALGPAGLDGAFTLINESYNANPASVAAALDVLASSQGRKIAILGDMLELGETSLALHKALSTLPSFESIDKIHCVGPQMATLHAALPIDKRGLSTPDSAEMAAKIARLIRPDDVVMVKGSLGTNMALIVDAIKNMGEATSQTTGSF
ncbi:MAG: UDP-N-acetylmuramoyl-tripeptide--D-alanyl-D-alanine ligase [Rhodobacteraceae bacterium]|nr:UDP-N-acetylmuramoyl-tripeptide--D-alanyl-D-alanine ligase [Paracoccaceae bacterium]